ncbi:MAG: hypothetical protein RIG67_29140 [Rhodospirillales bacterium]
MAVKSERSKLMQRFEALKSEEGLCDMKFFLGNVSEETVEAVCAEVNNALTLMQEGNFKEVNAWGDSQRPQDT